MEQAGKAVVLSYISLVSSTFSSRSFLQCEMLPFLLTWVLLQALNKLLSNRVGPLGARLMETLMLHLCSVSLLPYPLPMPVQ